MKALQCKTVSSAGPTGRSFETIQVITDYYMYSSTHMHVSCRILHVVVIKIKLDCKIKKSKSDPLFVPVTDSVGQAKRTLLHFKN